MQLVLNSGSQISSTRARRLSVKAILSNVASCLSRIARATSDPEPPYGDEIAFCDALEREINHDILHRPGW
jgi:hypothetical protein